MHVNFLKRLRSVISHKVPQFLSLFKIFWAKSQVEFALNIIFKFKKLILENDENNNTKYVKFLILFKENLFRPYPFKIVSF